MSLLTIAGDTLAPGKRRVWWFSWWFGLTCRIRVIDGREGREIHSHSTLLGLFTNSWWAKKYLSHDWLAGLVWGGSGGLPGVASDLWWRWTGGWGTGEPKRLQQRLVFKRIQVRSVGIVFRLCGREMETEERRWSRVDRNTGLNYTSFFSSFVGRDDEQSSPQRFITSSIDLTRSQQKIFNSAMAEEETKHHHSLFHHHKEGEDGPVDYEKEEKHHKHLEHVGELGTVAAGTYALHEKHKEKKDPDYAHKHKIEEEVAAAAAVAAGGYAFHEHHDKKDSKHERKEEEKAEGKHHHLF
ncbi:LOW QUALITY PROTEIN: hypothetical protein V2J09_023720 [Rumex salicifolius]